MLDPVTKGKILGMREAGKKFSEIAEHLNLPEGTVKTVCYREQNASDATVPKGRPKEISEKDKKKIIAATEKNPYATYRASAAALPFWIVLTRSSVPGIEALGELHALHLSCCCFPLIL